MEGLSTRLSAYSLAQDDPPPSAEEDEDPPGDVEAPPDEA
jgi:hypothetical protein